MPATSTIRNEYKIFELEGQARERAIRDLNIAKGRALQWGWYIEPFREIATIGAHLGIVIPETGPHDVWGISMTRHDITYKHGTGLRFSADYNFMPGAVRTFRQIRPHDGHIIDIAKMIYNAQRSVCYKMYASCRNNRNTYDMTGEDMEIHFTEPSVHIRSAVRMAARSSLIDALKQFAKWAAKLMRDKRDFLLADENILESLSKTGWRFRADGSWIC